MTESPMIVRLRVDLDEVTPRVRRLIEVPLGVTLADLHVIIQLAVGWTDSHLYEFSLGRSCYGEPDPDDDFGGAEILSAARARLADALKPATKSFNYIYDFGDGWEHTIRVEARSPAEPGASYPRLLAAEGRCPPEDVGGPYGYADFLQAIRNPAHPEHEHFREWYDAPFDPADADEAGIRSNLASFAKRLARRKASGAKKARP